MPVTPPPDKQAGRDYVGRFAPSPTGPLHFGSLLAAVASYLDARAQQGEWLLRIEDVDELRTVAGAREQIIQSLQVHGLHWDGEIHSQSNRKARYQQALEKLASKDLVYYCDCSRQQLREQASKPGAPYPGHCRHRRQADYREATKHSPASHAIRFDTRGRASVGFDDRLLGQLEYSLEPLGDFILRRRDSLFAYQLAVVVDDIEQGISDVVRGRDLLESTPWQLLLFEALGHPPPRYAHLPLITHAHDGAKLSKQTGAVALDNNRAAANLVQALEWLGQPTADYCETDAPATILQQAARHWQLTLIPNENKNLA